MSQASKPISSSGAVANIVRRELAGYFATPVAWVFIVIFLVMSGVLTFYIGSFYERGMADLELSAVSDAIQVSRSGGLGDCGLVGAGCALRRPGGAGVEGTEAGGVAEAHLLSVIG